ncbi:Mechanosensitive ion channel protein 9 [Cucumispora dikerogammari]|nr:Mechanosensitive ion channel protein 9 [Cucumispora dikerogammari]
MADDKKKNRTTEDELNKKPEVQTNVNKSDEKKEEISEETSKAKKEEDKKEKDQSPNPTTEADSSRKEEDLTKIKIPKQKKEDASDEIKEESGKDNEEKANAELYNELTPEEQEQRVQDERKSKNIKKQQNLDEMKNFMESEVKSDKERIFKNRLQEEMKFSFGKFNEYLDFQIQFNSPFFQLLIYCFLLVALFMPLPTILLIFYSKEIILSKVLYREGTKTPEMSSFRVAFFITAIYLVGYIMTYTLDNMVNVIFSLTELLDLQVKGILVNILTVLKQSRFHLRNALVTFFTFYLYEYMKKEYQWFSKNNSREHVLQTLFVWFAFLSLVLFIEKLIVNMLASTLRHESFENRILDTNSKTFVFKKMILISQADSESDKKILLESFTNQFDSGLFLKFSDLDYVSDNAAENIIESIFAGLNVKTLNFATIKKIFPENPDEVFYFLFGHFKDDYRKTEIDYEVLVERYRQLMEDRNNVEHSLNDRESIMGKLDFIFISGLSLLSVIFLMYLFNVDYKVYLAGLGPVMLGISWLFTDTIKELYSCFVFHLINHIYDCGDRLVINSIELIVKKVNLLYTKFVNINNRTVYIPTRNLINTQIENIRRSKEQFDVIEIDIDDSTKYDVIIKFKESLEKTLKTDEFNKQFTGKVQVRNFSNKFGNMYLETGIQHSSNFQSINQKFKRREKAIAVIVETLNSTGISYKPGFMCSG